MVDTSPVQTKAVTMNVWTLIIEAFKMLVQRDAILSERIAKLEEESGLDVTDESVTQSQLQELVSQMSDQTVPPVV
ncbi:hypothetical protein [Microcoleus sp. D2_18a_B4]|uniref:hypothetical protein n=1 Tax=Microcoleus sp. D2_18a_B4 TaxID=3055329 RepID=UPI002FD22DEF